MARFTTSDKLADHPKQIAISPYAYVGDNPITRTDPDGNCFPCIVVAELAEVGSAIFEAAGLTTLADAAVVTAGTAVTYSLVNGRSGIPLTVAPRDATVINKPAVHQVPAIVQARKGAEPGSRPGQVFTPKEKQKVKEKIGKKMEAKMFVKAVEQRQLNRKNRKKELPLQVLIPRLTTLILNQMEVVVLPKMDRYYVENVILIKVIKCQHQKNQDNNYGKNHI